MRYFKLLFFTFFVTTVTITLAYSVNNASQRSIYNKLQPEEEFSEFGELIRHNKDAKMDLLQQELTAFIPTNEAFQNYEKPLHLDLAYYHMAEKIRTLEDLKNLQNMSTLKENFPKLWITKTSDGIFINNAAILIFKSNYPEKTKNGRDQMFHVIDEVLDPVIRKPKFPHTAYDFMAYTDKWSLDRDKTVASFFYKVQENKLSHLYQIEGANTYFIPVDNGIEPYKFKMLNKHIIFGHMIPNFVLFTRPTMKGFNYETMANDDDIYIVLSLEEFDSKLYVKGHIITGNENVHKGVFMAEIIEANIPMHNGVVHLISHPLGIFTRTLKPFPYLSIMEKLATDPTLNIIYETGKRTGFNEIFTTKNVSFTYFIPNDYSWRQIDKKGLSFSESEVDILKRHLIISDMPYSMERLLAITSTKNFSDVELRTVGGILRLNVLHIENNFYIRWHNTYIKVIRPNYECSDGLMHILAGPIANLH